MSENALFELLWKDSKVFKQRYQRTEALLIAVVRVLKKNPEHLGKVGQQFVTLHTQFTQLPKPGQCKVLRDPTLYYWVRIAYELLFAILHHTSLPRLSRDHTESLGISDTSRALENHLHQFGLFYLAAGIINRQSIMLHTPVLLKLPYAIPGSTLAISTDTELAWSGVSEHGLIVEIDEKQQTLDWPTNGQESGTVLSDAILQRTPMVDTLDCAIALQPYVYNLPALDFAQLLVEAGVLYQYQHRGCVESALTVFNHYEPELFEQFRSVMRVIAMKPSEAGTFRDNLSHSDLPGAIVLKPVYEPYYLAHVLIHEFHHNRLFFIEDGNPILAGHHFDVEKTTRCYSPWRLEPRPLHGVLHGLYVFIPVTRYWIKVYQDAALPEQTRKLAHDQIVRSLIQMRIAYRQLLQFAEFTAFGDQVFYQMRLDIDKIEANIIKNAIPVSALSVSGLVDDVFDYSRNTAYKDAATVVDDVQVHLQENASTDEASDLMQSVINRYLAA